jgi:Fur family transcriptional regulator, ferric uptake regulator
MKNAPQKRRNTPSKQRVLSFMEQHKEAVSHEMLEEALGNEMNRVTIYRILNRFEEDGIVHKIVSDEGIAHFALCSGCDHRHEQHNHIHFRCVKCQTVECLHENVDLKVPPGYTVNDTNLMVSGICVQCNSISQP